MVPHSNLLSHYRVIINSHILRLLKPKVIENYCARKVWELGVVTHAFSLST